RKRLPPRLLVEPLADAVTQIRSQRTAEHQQEHFLPRSQKSTHPRSFSERPCPVMLSSEGDEIDSRGPQPAAVDRDLVFQRIGPVDAKTVLKETPALAIRLGNELAGTLLA